MARALITGASGFVGRALTHALSEAGHAVTALTRADGDVSDAATWARLPPVDQVFHLAARSFVPDSWRDAAGFIHTNMFGTIRALDYCRPIGAHLVFASAYVYGTPARLPIRENDPAAPSNPYALSKFLAEQVCLFYAATAELPVTILRPFNIFGPGQRAEFLIPTVLHQVRAGRDIRVKDLAPRRDYVFIDDVIAAFLRTMENPRGPRVFNIGSGVSHSVQEVIDAIQLAAGTQLPVVSDEEPRPGEVSDVRADISRAREMLGWQPRITFAEGIARLVAAER